MPKPISDALIHELRIAGPLSGSELCTRLGISQPTLSRWVQKQHEELRIIGARKNARYALRRSIPGLGDAVPLYRIDTDGEAHELGELWLCRPQATLWKSTAYDGFPYFLTDARPQGFLGRSFAKRRGDLRLSPDLKRWSEDDYWIALSARGEDLPGNLIVGAESFDRWMNRSGARAAALLQSERPVRYPALAEAALQDEEVGSSAGGEQPKFSALVDGRSVLVKFSPSTEQPAGRRWADLLVAEHLALETLREAGFSCSSSELIISQSRYFLEVERFDRTPSGGRRGVTSLAALSNEFTGETGSWSKAAKALHTKGWVSAQDLRQIQNLDQFGALIANADRHFGNLSFFHEIGTRQTQLAPVYDMLPMFFRPSPSGEVVERKFELPAPEGGALESWKAMRPWALKFWGKVVCDPRISEGFRAMITIDD